ncbi:MAG TPA: UDP-2,4-diacetamido-2,4,6-trideoxy-beta-L-altropyranose hydrolase [Chromatiaceae bacterium]|nr:UDP-2,4-diacetamido-2,4,6-trideoxy-beta-L-altropyranose hydrolase [Chromatiaceae bacterium]
MHLTIRVDASIEMGTGHVMRCLTLAKELKSRGADILFVTRALTGHMAETIANHGFSVKLLPEVSVEYRPKNHDVPHAEWLKVSLEQDASETIQALSNRKTDWLIVDHYALDARWHRALRKYTYKIFAIDDLADRKLDCDLLLDQTYGRNETDYRAITPGNCNLLLGSKYALLRSEFRALRSAARKKRKQCQEVQNILITMGGIDRDNVTGKILDALPSATYPLFPSVDIILSSNAPHVEDVIKAANQHPFMVNVSIDVHDMAMRMLKADLAIGASGTTTWERCCLGLPSIVFVLAKNQKNIALHVEKENAAFCLGNSTPKAISRMQDVFSLLHQDAKILTDMSEAAFGLVDGDGVDRVAHKMENLL